MATSKTERKSKARAKKVPPVLSVVLDKALRQRLEALAKESGLTLSDYVRGVLGEAADSGDQFQLVRSIQKKKDQDEG